MVGSVLLEPAGDLELIAQIELGPGGREDVREAVAFEAAHDRRAHETAVAGHEHPAVAIDHHPPRYRAAPTGQLVGATYSVEISRLSPTSLVGKDDIDDP